MGSTFTESVVEVATLEWFAAIGYTVVAGPSLAPGEPGEASCSTGGYATRFIG